MGRIKRATGISTKLGEVGKIKIGDKKMSASGKEYPVSLDYFRATGNYAKMFYDQYGEKCSKLPIVFPTDDINQVCNEEYQIRDKAGRLVGSGDGTNWKFFNPTTEKYDDIVKEYDQVISELKPGLILKPILQLRFLLLDIKVMGFWRFETSGDASSIPQIRDTFDFVREQAGTVVNIPFDLIVEKVKSQKPDSKSQYPVVKLIPNLSAESAEKLHEFLSSGGTFRGLLTEQKLALLGAASDVVIQEEKPKADTIEEVEFEEVKPEDAVVIACKAMKDAETYDAAGDVWRNNKELWKDPKFLQAREDAKKKFGK